MTLGRWADYSAGYPGAANLKAAGFIGAIRYVGLGTSGKCVTSAEYADFAHNGLGLLLVAEQTTTDAWGGYAAGVRNAQIARADARAKGLPDTMPILAAADAHAADQGQINAAVAYAQGFQDVLGKSTGFYGFSEVLSAVHNAGIGSVYWRCGSQPSAAEQAWTHFWQRNAAPTLTLVGGVDCDINEQYLPVGTPQEDDLTPDQWAFIRNAHIFAEQCLRTMVNQTTGQPKGEPSFDPAMNWRDGFLPGFPNGDKSHNFTVADFVRQADWNSFQAHANTDAIAAALTALQGVLAETHTYAHDADAKLDTTNAALASVSSGGVDVATLASKLAAALGPVLAGQLAAQLQITVGTKS